MDVKMMKRALINELQGRMGPNLADFLRNKGYEVHGIVGRVAPEDPIYRLARIMHLVDKRLAKKENFSVNKRISGESNNETFS
jgi:GDP-D-mannose dehydratase